MKVDQIFNCHNYSEEKKKIRLASIEFEGYALVWWNQLQVDVDWLRRPRVTTRLEMKRVLKERFVLLIIEESCTTSCKSFIKEI